MTIAICPLRVCPIGVLVVAIAGCGGTASNERLVTREEFADRWPFTVASGILACDQSRSALGAVVFRVNNQTFALNGTARSQGYQPVEQIWRTNPQGLGAPPATVVDRLPELQRREIFAVTVDCEDAANEQAQKQFPETDASRPGFNRANLAALLEKQNKLAQTLTRRCETQIRKQYNLSESEYESISQEGSNYSWPPLSPLRVNIGPMIDAGLALCRR